MGEGFSESPFPPSFFINLRRFGKREIRMEKEEFWKHIRYGGKWSDWAGRSGEGVLRQLGECDAMEGTLRIYLHRKGEDLSKDGRYIYGNFGLSGYELEAGISMKVVGGSLEKLMDDLYLQFLKDFPDNPAEDEMVFVEEGKDFDLKALLAQIKEEIGGLV